MTNDEIFNALAEGKLFPASPVRTLLDADTHPLWDGVRERTAFKATTFKWGKYKGKTIESVIESNPGYLYWLNDKAPRMNKNPFQESLSSLLYNESPFNERMPFGKHKGKWFSELKGEHSYIEWCRSQGSSLTGVLARFLQYTGQH
jgi:uncharacterized protein (DUF3820 family)